MEIVSGIHRIYRISNSYLVVDDEIMIIDTGMPGNSRKILDYLRNTLKRDPSDIKTIVLTHHHFDHVGGLGELKRITGAKVAAHIDDAYYISGKKTPDSLFARAITGIFKLIKRSQLVEVDIILEDGDKIGDYQVLHTPGHTPGSISLYNPKNKAIFVGDILRCVKGEIKGPVPRFTPDIRKANESLKKLGDLDIEVILTGHTPPLTSNASAKLKEYLKTI
ncbi:MAG: MBL fold metallo-hydrolase [Euryarchaeota archaeon]|nr:MBL fold metallo-hydrolase [Euryarchaeota archaeon]